ncbi:MAG: NAPDH-dependent diflavin reductase [Pycnora praestabilis]|nr:MAG: NAPDH-dependent diflavin reductase [Pycnora praestabilis]
MAINGLRHDRTALILYGSETGNAQDIAEELGRIAERLRFLTRVSDLDAIDNVELSDFTVVVIAISTTGQGDLPFNARKFWKGLLRKRLPQDYLCEVDFTTFGLGDSSYPKFNWAARKLHKRIVQLGAHEIYPRGEADEQHPEGLDGSFLPWSVDLRKHLLQRYPLPGGVSPIPGDVLLQPKWTLEFARVAGNEEVEKQHQGENSNPSFQPANGGSRGLLSTPSPDGGDESQSGSDVPEHDLLPIQNALIATLIRNDRLTPAKHWQDVRHLTFRSVTPASYGPGDVLTIFPKNFPADVDHLIKLMDWDIDADRPIKFVSTSSSIDMQAYPPPPVPYLLPYPQLTLRSLLTNYLDITAIPRRSFFSLIAHFTEDEMHKGRLLEFTNPEYVDELYDYTTRPRRSILEVLQEFESVKVPWRWIGTVLPILRGRQFSITSGGERKLAANGDSQIELLVAIVRYRTVIKKIRQGVCTRYIAALPEGTQLNVLFQKGGLNISRAEAKKPVIMIGPGTGVAPMRSLIWERLAWAKEMQKQHESIALANGADGHGHDTTIGENVLFFGCRNNDADYFYKDEWVELKEKMDLQVFTAFSRDQRAKIYVQDLVRQQSALVYRLLHAHSGIVYICGSSGKMPQAVREALIEAFQTEGEMDRESAEAYLLSMEKEGRYKQETW